MKSVVEIYFNIEIIINVNRFNLIRDRVLEIYLKSMFYEYRF